MVSARKLSAMQVLNQLLVAYLPGGLQDGTSNRLSKTKGLIREKIQEPIKFQKITVQERLGRVEDERKQEVEQLPALEGGPVEETRLIGREVAISTLVRRRSSFPATPHEVVASEGKGKGSSHDAGPCGRDSRGTGAEANRETEQQMTMKLTLTVYAKHVRNAEEAHGLQGFGTWRRRE